MGFGAETVSFFEVDQKKCTRVYGESPCTARIGVTGTEKCRNTRFTCQDPANYLEGPPLTLRFARDQEGLKQYGYLIPSILDIETTPGRINLSAMNQNAKALGEREQVKVTFQDHRHSDHKVDPYRLERAFVPAVRWPGRFRPSMFRRPGGAEQVARSTFFGHYDSAEDPYKKGSFWGKWIARNPYYPSYDARVREGVIAEVPRFNAIADSGTAQGSTNNTLTLRPGASAVNGAYNGMLLRLTAIGDGRARRIATYDGATKVATLNENWQASYLSLPGANGNFASTPDSPATSVIGDIDVRMKLALNDWTPPGERYFLSKGLFGPGASWIFGGNNGILFIYISSDGVNWIVTSALNSIAGVPFTDGEIGWIRFTRNSATGVFKFYTSIDGVTWPQLGTDKAGAAGAMFDTTSALGIDMWSQHTTGKVYYVEVRNGIDGPVVARFDPRRADMGATQIIAETGEIWTINQSGNAIAELAGPPPGDSAYEILNDLPDIDAALASMRTRHYVLTDAEGPNEGGFSLEAIDLFSKIEARKAVAPFPSKGELSADITSAPATFTVLPSGIGSLTPENGGYSTITNVVQGYVAIGKEIKKVTRVGDTFTVVENGSFGTTAVEHKDEDLVQLVLTYDAQLVQNVIYDLATVYGRIATTAIDKPHWDLLAADLSDLYTARIPKPTPVEQLIGDICQQAGVTVFPDVTTGMIEFVPLRAGSIAPTVTDRAFIREGSLSVKRDESRRVSSVWVYYGMKVPTESPDEESNYHSRVLVTDLAAIDQYGADSARNVFGRWIPQFGRQLAERCGQRILAMFRDPPLTASFKVDASRASSFALGQYFYLQTADVQDANGEERLVPMAAISMERGENEVAIEAQSVAFVQDPGTGVRTIYIENSGFNFNLRSIHDSLFATPTGAEVVEFIILPGVIVGSTSTGSPAMRTGTWPQMATKPKITFQNPGALAKPRVQGKGGKGGAGAVLGVSSAEAGENGGPAFLAEAQFDVAAQYAEIWAGGGGGGGGQIALANGGGGGGAAGTNPGAAGSAQGPAQEGASGSSEAGGSGGDSANPPNGRGGDGAGPGLDGSAGNGASAGAGGTRGYYVVGNSLVNWITTGDFRGAVS